MMVLLCPTYPSHHLSPSVKKVVNFTNLALIAIIGVSEILIVLWYELACSYLATEGNRNDIHVSVNIYMMLLAICHLL